MHCFVYTLNVFVTALNYSLVYICQYTYPPRTRFQRCNFIKIMIKYQTYIIPSHIILTNEVLNSFIIKFWEDVYKPIINKLGQSKHLMVICKVKYSENNKESYKSLAPLRRIGFEDQELFSGYLQERLGILIESYEPLNYSEIEFTYIIKDGEISSNDRRLLKDLSNKEIPFHDFNKIKLPISMNYKDYGILITKEVMDGFTRYITSINKRIFQIDVNLDNKINNVTILGLSDFKWTDTQLEGNSNYFKREIGRSTIYFLDGEIILEKKVLNAKSFRRLRSR